MTITCIYLVRCNKRLQNVFREGERRKKGMEEGKKEWKKEKEIKGEKEKNVRQDLRLTVLRP